MLYFKILKITSQFICLIKKYLNLYRYFLKTVHVNNKVNNRYNNINNSKKRPLMDFIFEPIDDNQEDVDLLFFRLKNLIFNQYSNKDILFKKISKRFLKERGKTTEGNPYFYLQPINEEGLLFEKTTKGWNIYVSNKIPNTNTFLRRYEPWDLITLYKNKNGVGFPRVKSQRFGTELMSFIIYEQKLLKSVEEYINNHAQLS